MLGFDEFRWVQVLSTYYHPKHYPASGKNAVNPDQDGKFRDVDEPADQEDGKPFYFDDKSAAKRKKSKDGLVTMTFVDFPELFDPFGFLRRYGKKRIKFDALLVLVGVRKKDEAEPEMCPLTTLSWGWTFFPSGGGTALGWGPRGGSEDYFREVMKRKFGPWRVGPGLLD